MIWYVHRRQDGSIASAHAELQPGYATEALDDRVDQGLITHRAMATNPGHALDANARAMIVRRADELEKGTLAQQVEALRLRFSLIEGG